MILLELFYSFIKIGLFSFGGGYAAIPLINQEIVVNHGWLSLDAFSNVLTISQMTPGPVGINSATFIGIQLAGLPGAIVATLGFVIPSIIIVSILGHLYLKYNGLKIIQEILEGLRPVIIATILAAGLSLFLAAVFESQDFILENLNFVKLGLFILALFLTFKYKISPIIIMLLVGLINVVITYSISLL